MHDTLEYFKKDPIYRQFHQNDITFSLVYGFTENFMLPLSHDEVVHGKGALMDRMPGDEWQRFANYRLLFAYMFTHPGTKLSFMSMELAQTTEWKHDHELAWQLLQYPNHSGVQNCIKALNQLYCNEPALFEKSFDPSGFEWIDMGDAKNSVLVYMRKGHELKDQLLIVANFTPRAHDDYRVGVHGLPHWKEIFNSDDPKFGGTGQFVNKKQKWQEESQHGQEHSLVVKLPPLGLVVLKGLKR
jgi:1,4-alpha-glucan branching enzyme